MHTPTCRYYLAGYCRNGDECIFLHPNPCDSRPSFPNSLTNFPRRSPKPKLCRFYQMGHCVYGDGCDFLHPRNITKNTPQQQLGCFSNHLLASATKSDRFHFRKSADTKVSSPPKFSFKQTLELLETQTAESKIPTKREDFGYMMEEVYSAKENLSAKDLEVYSKDGIGTFRYIPLLPPPEELCC